MQILTSMTRKGFLFMIVNSNSYSSFSNLTQLCRPINQTVLYTTKQNEKNWIEIGTKIMYPKVKADNGADNYKQRSSCLNLNYLQSRASENNQEDDLHIYVAKIPKIYIPSVLISESESTVMNKPIRGADIEVKPKTKASPILRPRAVVSSPDNDAMIGNINMIEERKAKKGLKSDDHIRSRASQRKNVSTNVKISHRIVAKQSGVSSRDHK